MVVFSSATTNRPRWFWRFTLLAITLTLVAGAFLWRTLEIAAITEVQAKIEALNPVFTGIRWLLIGLVAGFWPALTDWFYRRGRIDTAEKNQLKALRWRVLAWLVVLELMVGQNLPGHFLQAIQGSGA